ncbi:unnamed protein product [Kluyveromyces dobzhanskii CBS 2104]|uniref:Ubiquitin-like protein ATG12 n=1 Tax=Kluyveromyces dobzhanskii CBS 2104 TaxID=1427455 RepID=A0A0A8L4C9_9SACH|nr:unnamed protein product [Kluyveromyces dobzhanskii CBS 2104]
MNSGVLLSESETDTSEISTRQSDLISGDESIKGKLEEFSAKLNELRLGDPNSDAEEQENSPGSKSQREESFESSENVSKSSTRPAGSITSIPDVGPLKTDLRIKIRLQPIGAVPQIQPRVCQISANQQFLALTKFLCKRLKRKHIHCYINNAFAPALNQNIGDLWSQFKVNDELIVSYCESVAFG